MYNQSGKLTKGHLCCVLKMVTNVFRVSKYRSIGTHTILSLGKLQILRLFIPKSPQNQISLNNIGLIKICTCAWEIQV